MSVQSGAQRIALDEATRIGQVKGTTVVVEAGDRGVEKRVILVATIDLADVRKNLRS